MELNEASKNKSTSKGASDGTSAGSMRSREDGLGGEERKVVPVRTPAGAINDVGSSLQVSICVCV